MIRRRARATLEARVRIGRDLRRMRDDAGLTEAVVARAAGISRAHLCAIEHGKAEASTGVLVAITDTLGADLTIRAYPNTGPRIRDRIQAQMVEALLAVAHRRWHPYLEVPVTRPARGYIDIVFGDVEARLFITTEVHSQLPRVEQSLRWAADKAESLPSADVWRSAPAGAEISRMLVLRSTRATHDLARQLPHLLAAAYPASSRSVFDALTGTAPWPGPGIVWVRVEGGRAVVLDRPPRGAALGR